MIQIKTYNTSHEYLNDTESFLEKNELENNIILGNCYKYISNNDEQSQCYFVNCFEENIIKATSMIVNSRVIISGDLKSPDYSGYPADHYLSKSLSLIGVMGLTKSAETFSNNFHSGKTSARTLILQKLTQVNKSNPAEGTFEKVQLHEAEITAKMINDFIMETDTFRGKTKEDLLRDTIDLIKSNSFFKWVNKGSIVSISAIMRKTKNAGIIGLVYTPSEFRGNGYASGCVQKLSEYILQSGLKSCGLFVDKANPVSFSIYKRIGYRSIAEFSDIKFL